MCTRLTLASAMTRAGGCGTSFLSILKLITTLLPDIQDTNYASLELPLTPASLRSSPTRSLQSPVALRGLL